MPKLKSTYCRECSDEVHEGKRNYCELADFVLWGKLLPQEALGPKCYDHAVQHVGYRALSYVEQYAIYDLRPVHALIADLDKLVERHGEVKQ